MANYIPSNLVKAQAKLIAAFQSSELRFRQPETFLAFLRNTSIMFPAYELLRTREDRTVETYYRKRTARALGTARSHNHSGVKGDTGVLTPSWSTKADLFAISLKQGDNNVYDYSEQLDNEVQNIVANFAEGLETAAVAHLFNNRSSVNGSTAEGTFNAVQNVFEITDTTNGNRAIQITRGVMTQLKYAGMLMVFCDTIAFNKFMFLGAQGVSNATNTSFQFQGVTFIHSIELAGYAAGLATPYTKGMWAAVPEGTIGVLPWIPKQNREGVDTKVNQYMTLLNPVDGLNYAVHKYETRSDDTATNGLTQDVSFQYQVSIDVAFQHAPLSVSGETTIQVFALI